eukprot:SAG11_NODE_55_length_19449_cov_28.630135_16_plen_114_part_00
MTTYGCPEGSVIIFTESLLHASAHSDAEWPRVSIFNCYNSVHSALHRLTLKHDDIMAMPPKRRSLFRAGWGTDFGRGESNRHYSEKNSAAHPDTLWGASSVAYHVTADPVSRL